jgi:mediator of RNA polymerase II transcription subunit 8
MTDHITNPNLSEVFEKTVTYPSTNFPGRTQEVLLGQLLRKKLEPGVERWVEERKALQGETESMEALEAQWKEARDSVGEMAARAAITNRKDQYTAEEREMGIENAKTGLRNQIRWPGDEESESDEDENEDEEMEDVNAKKGTTPAEPLDVKEKKIEGPVRTLDEIVRFGTTGLAPEDEVQANVMAFRK